MNYEFDSDPSRLDLGAIWEFLSTQAPWHRWRTREDVEAQIRGAWRVVGVYTEHGNQIGFARAVSDGVNDAYLADVYVLPEHRGHNLGRLLVEEMIENGPGRDFRWTLFTSSAHGLYSKFGFVEPSHTSMVRPGRRAERIMEAVPDLIPAESNVLTMEPAA
ncbi:N-acetyltransferase [Mycetocola tolaasinivorans]|uniref:N-acetyltransferase n=1 Tax=Mycetocola tolaasinivorans TaxID=76635 RepID=A0A3L7A6R5_9MICO|nr:GNAT family N-acetyltransferase [Mycetocola tolaasinivorans]RLP75251.1 N-acetyltransferase [Mycetocola tolaasinivorans]